jgi:hypothetical protein
LSAIVLITKKEGSNENEIHPPLSGGKGKLGFMSDTLETEKVKLFSNAAFLDVFFLDHATEKEETVVGAHNFEKKKRNL